MKEEFKFNSEKLYEFRKMKGMSQEEFAEKVGVSRQSIYAWESGKSIPDIENLYKMCQVLEIKTNELTNFYTEGKEENKKRNIKKIISITLLAIFIIYLIIALRQFFIVANLNKKIHNIEDYTNYSYQYMRAELEKDEMVNMFTQDVYYKEGILKFTESNLSSSTDRKQIIWTDFKNNEQYIFLEENNEKTVRRGKIFGVEEPIYQINNISNNGMIAKENSKNFLAAILFPFSYRVSSSQDWYVLNFKTKDRYFKYDNAQFISKTNGFPVENQEFRSDGRVIYEKYKDIKINETTEENIKMPSLEDYKFIEE